MIEVLGSPLFIVIGALMFLLLSLPRIKGNLLARIGRVIGIGLTLMAINQLHYESQQKVCAAQKKISARRIAEFTEAMGTLITSNREEDARVLLKEFSNEIESIAGDDPRVAEFIDSLMKRASANKAL